MYFNSLNTPDWSNIQHLYTKKDLDLSKPLEEVIQMKVPGRVRTNGTMYAYVVLANNNFEGDVLEDVSFLL